jgi:hypothetical protein
MDGHLEPDAAGAIEAPRDGSRFAREVWWAVFVVAFAVYVVTGRVRTFLGAEGHGRSSVWTIWRRLAGDLPSVSAPGLLRVAYLAMLIVFAGGCLAALWLALAADGSDEPAAEESTLTADRRDATIIPFPTGRS